jgi:hypothetical protein
MEVSRLYLTFLGHFFATLDLNFFRGFGKALFDNTFFLLFSFQNKNINKQLKTQNTQNYFHISVKSKQFFKQKTRSTFKRHLQTGLSLGLM